MKEYGFQVSNNRDEDYDLKDFIFYRFGYGPLETIQKRLTGSTNENSTGSEEKETLSPKEIFDEYRTEQRHKKELEDLISDARKRTETKKVENNEAPKSSNAENSKND